MKCLVSGATGFIGRHLCQQLAARGGAITALSRSGGTLDDGTVTQALDLATTELEPQLLRGVSVVFHLAGVAHQRADASAYERLNHRATLRLARLAAAQGVQCFVFLSSVKAMGPALGPQRRAETDCTAPVDAYGLSKWQAECDLRREFAGGPMSIVILRPALVYGPRARGNLQLLARGVRWGMPRPPGEGSRSMIALQDLVALMCDVAQHPPTGVKTWIVCDDDGYSTRYLYDLLRTADGRGRGLAWLPRWAWRLAANLLDQLGGRSGEATFDKLFGTELYDNSAVSMAMNWHPVGRLPETAAELLAGA